MSAVEHHGSKSSLTSEEMTFDENLLYSSEDPNIFKVSVVESEVTKKCHLQGDYELFVNTMNIALCEPYTENTVYVWPYRYIRRYGKSRTNFTFEAGRKCPSGEGLFSFNTTQGNDIFLKINEKMQEIKTRERSMPKSLALNTDTRRGSNTSENAMTPEVPDRKYLFQKSNNGESISELKDMFERTISADENSNHFKKSKAAKVSPIISPTKDKPGVKPKPRPADKPVLKPIVAQRHSLKKVIDTSDDLYAEPDEASMLSAHKVMNELVYDEANVKKCANSPAWKKYGVSSDEMLHEENYDLHDATKELPQDLGEYDHITLRLDKMKIKDPSINKVHSSNVYGKLSHDSPPDSVLYSQEDEYQIPEGAKRHKEADSAEEYYEVV